MRAMLGLRVSVLMAILLLGVSVEGGSNKYSHPHSPRQHNNNFIPILKLHASNDNKGNYDFDSEGGDGTRFAESGGLKSVKGAVVGVKEGQVSWTSPEGQFFTLSYTADEKGFHPVGDHLPTPPPIPQEIARSLKLLPKLKETSGYAYGSGYGSGSGYSVPNPLPSATPNKPQGMKPKPSGGMMGMMGMMGMSSPVQTPAMMKPQSESNPPPVPQSHPPMGMGMGMGMTSFQEDTIVPILMGSQPKQPLQTDVRTPEFSIHSDPTNTVVRIGKF